MQALKDRRGIQYVIGPDGTPITHADLPCVKTERWVPSRKAQVVAAVRFGLITEDEACSRYRLSTEEYQSWQAAVERGGAAALRRRSIRENRRAAHH